MNDITVNNSIFPPINIARTTWSVPAPLMQGGVMHAELSHIIVQFHVQVLNMPAPAVQYAKLIHLQ